MPESVFVRYLIGISVQKYYFLYIERKSYEIPVTVCQLIRILFFLRVHNGGCLCTCLHVSFLLCINLTARRAGDMADKYENNSDNLIKGAVYV